MSLATPQATMMRGTVVTVHDGGAMTAPLPAFRPRFPLADVARWATRYPAANDTEVETVGWIARSRGCYTREEFLTVTRWKAGCGRSRCERNSEDVVQEATGLALHAADERLRIGLLTLLHGVELPTASVLLHLAHPDPYPVLDARALWSLGVEQPPASYTFDFWLAYVHACRELAAHAHVPMRVLDRALWRYAIEHPTSGEG